MKKNTFSKLLVLVLCFVLMVCVLAGCKKDEPAPTPEGGYTGANTLVVGYSRFSQKFSPFFSKTAYDQDVAAMTQVSLLTSDRQGNVVLNGIDGETIKYNGTEYLYKGIADIDIEQKKTGDVVTSVEYSIKIRDDIKFSDGTAMTIDDVIFNMYVLSDPSYDGSSTFYAQPIQGMEEYRAGMQSWYKLLVAAGRANVDYTLWTAAEQTAFWAAVDAAGPVFAQTLAEEIMATYGIETLPEAAAGWGFTLDADNQTAAGFWAKMVAKYGDDIIKLDSVESLDTPFTDCLEGYDSYTKALATGTTAANIPGIQRIDDYNMKVVMTKFDATSIYQLGISVAPLAYYGDTTKYDFANNKFGFDKGNLTTVRAKTTTPMGAGAYKFVKYESGIVHFEKNDNYYKGAPKIQYIQFKETDDKDKVSGVQAGTFDVTDPSFSTTAVNAIKAANTNGELAGNVITTNTVDNLGYGYLGINAANVNVGGDIDSDASKNLRRAFATLFAAYRETSVVSYYGNRAAVINYPISNTSWAAPQAADEGYEIAFSTNVDGDPIYTADMTSEQKWAAAKTAAIGFFKAAGYTFDEATGEFTAAPAGAKMSYEVIIPGDGIGDHPSFAILTWAEDILESIGIDLVINDPSDSNVLWDAIEGGTHEMWGAAWGATVDPDMYQVYYSTNVVGVEGSTESNHYHIQDTELDEKIMAARVSDDKAFRKATYKECLDIIADWAVEIPVYQRQNAIIFSSERVNLETVTPDITTFWGWMQDIENLEMK